MKKEKLIGILEKAKQFVNWRNCLTIGVLGTVSLCSTAGALSQTEKGQYYLHWASNAFELAWSLANDEESDGLGSRVIDLDTRKVEHYEELQAPESLGDQIPFLLAEHHQDVVEHRRDLICGNPDLQTLMYYRVLSDEGCEIVANDPIEQWLILGLDESSYDDYHRSDIATLIIYDSNSGKFKKFDLDRSLVMALGLDQGSYGNVLNVSTVTHLEQYRVLGETDPIENAATVVGIATGRPVDVVIAGGFEGYLDVMGQLIPPEGMEIEVTRVFAIDKPDAPLRRAYPEFGNGLFPPGTYTFTAYDTLHAIRTRILTYKDEEGHQQEWNRDARDRNKFAFEIGVEVINNKLKGGMSVFELLNLVDNSMRGSDQVWMTDQTYPLTRAIERMDRVDLSNDDVVLLVVDTLLRMDSFTLGEAPVELVNGLYDGTKLKEVVLKELRANDDTYRVMIGTESGAGHFTMSMAPIVVVREKDELQLTLDWSLLNGIESYEAALDDPEQLDILRNYYSLFRYVLSQEVSPPEVLGGN